MTQIRFLHTSNTARPVMELMAELLAAPATGWRIDSLHAGIEGMAKHPVECGAYLPLWRAKMTEALVEFHCWGGEG